MRTKIQKGDGLSAAGGVVWFTGISGAGKSTLSRRVGAELKKHGVRMEILDGDVIRTNLSRGLGFSKEDRALPVRARSVGAWFDRPVLSTPAVSFDKLRTNGWCVSKGSP